MMIHRQFSMIAILKSWIVSVISIVEIVEGDGWRRGNGNAYDYNMMLIWSIPLIWRASFWKGRVMMTLSRSRLLQVELMFSLMNYSPQAWFYSYCSQIVLLGAKYVVLLSLEEQHCGSVIMVQSRNDRSWDHLRLSLHLCAK